MLRRGRLTIGGQPRSASSGSALTLPSVVFQRTFSPYVLLEANRSDDALILHVRGVWRIDHVSEIESALGEISPGNATRVIVDFGALEFIDLSGAWLLHRWLGRAS